MGNMIVRANAPARLPAKRRVIGQHFAPVYNPVAFFDLGYESGPAMMTRREQQRRFLRNANVERLNVQWRWL